MTARCIFFVTDRHVAARATVVLTPSWLARLFGARVRSVDLYMSARGWFTVASVRPLENIEHSSLIRYALDFREIGSPARWTLPAGAEAVAP